MNRETLNCNKILTKTTDMQVMGILNVTPDSFFDGGAYLSEYAVQKRIESMVTEGVDILDVGAYSSRPGADHISCNEELERLEPVLAFVKKNFPGLIVSVDTFRSEIAEIALKNYGVEIINDISGGDLDDKMYKVVAKYKAIYIIMHMQGNPQNMQNNPSYTSVVSEVIKNLQNKIVRCHQAGINDIIVDPGFGFGKTLDDNYALLSHLKTFYLLNKPVLVGVSRKSMLYNLLDINAEQALPATIAANMMALQNGATILRVHDVKEAKHCVEIAKKLKEVESRTR